jgi:hypothetical protein
MKRSGPGPLFSLTGGRRGIMMKSENGRPSEVEKYKEETV